MPGLAGLRRRPVQAISGGPPSENARLLVELLEGRGREPDRDVVALNAGALLATAGLAPTLRDGTQMAIEAIHSSAARRVLEAFLEASRG